jgi:hypothetical protein
MKPMFEQVSITKTTRQALRVAQALTNQGLGKVQKSHGKHK